MKKESGKREKSFCTKKYLNNDKIYGFKYIQPFFPFCFLLNFELCKWMKILLCIHKLSYLKKNGVSRKSNETTIICDSLKVLKSPCE